MTQVLTTACVTSNALKNFVFNLETQQTPQIKCF